MNLIILQVKIFLLMVDFQFGKKFFVDLLKMNNPSKNRIKIGKRYVGLNYKPLIIAELGINHGGSLTQAKKLVDIAFKSGVENN